MRLEGILTGITGPTKIVDHLGAQHPIPPSGITACREQEAPNQQHECSGHVSCPSNVPVSGAAAELYNPAGHSPRPLYWQVRRLVAFPNELILRHATRRGGPMAHVRAR